VCVCVRASPPWQGDGCQLYIVVVVTFAGW